MKNTFTRRDLEKFDDRFENIFALPYESDKIADQLIEEENFDFNHAKQFLLRKNFTLVLCIPRIPTFNNLKKAKIIDENDTFRLLKVDVQDYDFEIEKFLLENEYSYIFFWVKKPNNLKYILPKSSRDRLKLLALFDNEIYSFRFELKECIIASWY
ncbi:hypothetical protein [Bacillus sp. FJAT-52991]|uniref:Uncharacterized protein n=1 Tax=Bacillus kandeliae TaxID=3129297 RepID=A0ABZ2N1P6_9BACI